MYQLEHERFIVSVNVPMFVDVFRSHPQGDPKPLNPMQLGMSSGRWGGSLSSHAGYLECLAWVSEKIR